MTLFILSSYSYAQKSQSKDRQPTKIAKYVVDETGTLKQDDITYLMQKLINFEKETSNQLVVYIIPSLNGESIEEVAIELAEENKIGQKGKDNGVLLLITMNDKKMRIEVGYGLEGALPDATALSIINNESLLIILLLLFIFPVYLSSAVRRLHDIGRTGWLILIPFVTILIPFIVPDQKDNKYGLFRG